MAEQRVSRVTYDMPQEQLNYFDSRARSSQGTAASTNARAAGEVSEHGRTHEAPQLIPQKVLQGHSNKSSEAPKTAATRGSLLDHYQQFFAAAQPRSGAAVPPGNAQGAPTSHYPHRLILEERPAGPNSAAPKTLVRQTGPEAVRPAKPAYQAAAGQQSNEDAEGHSESSRGTGMDDFAWSHHAPSTPPQRSAASEPSESCIPSNSATRANRYRDRKEELPLTPLNDYVQPRGDRQAPVRKSSIPPGTPMSCDSRSQRGESSAFVNGREAPQHLPRSHMSRDTEAIPHVRKLATEPRQQQRSQPQEAHQQPPVAREKDDAAERMRDDEVNCTFHPKTNYSSRRSGHNFHDSPYRGSQGTNPPRNSRGDYDQTPYNAERSRRSSESRPQQARADAVGDEANEDKNGTHAAATQPRRPAAERAANADEVFLRLYADAQRYNHEKSEQERLLSLRREEERGVSPFDWNKGVTRKEASAEQAAMSGDGKSASPPRRSSSQQRPLKNRELFARLARPTSVTFSFQKQKEMEEQEKQEKEQRELAQKKLDMERISRYNWGIPTKSFTFADLKSQNAMYVS
ncbi:hypothetical protein ABL78_4954 [Leptomonas seymouri]|uniref:Uncharacterized protein n=1 Tax=Leptomonas seymouri TaxID=5684 RepID=A0A0N1I2U8_LEPSE|nr:hypothetical protein ABL78_4954 [Leptomonas seymouri]|eukprot:KPI85992.1 hypothetical protein ABL78_4954 [Leptomonas seymouri]